jgi:type III restriction enzyme
MKIKFDASQQYQLDAIETVVDLFSGQPMAGQEFEINSTFGALNMQHSTLGFGNRLVLSDAKLLENLRTVQGRNELELSEKLLGDTVEYEPQKREYRLTHEDKENSWHVPHFSVEMETGTGKTYVYLRSIFELHKNYGFTKFIIVVPTVAIREGVKTSIDLTAEHFKTLYDNTPINSWVYDSKYASRLRDYAASNQIQILIINIDAFNKKDIAVIHNERDQTSGRKPIEFIQACNPIVILDEPQNMESEIAREAIASLNPLCTLRYSATHRNPYNVIYRLGPVKAYDLGLVKRIEVDSVLEDPNFNKPFIQVQSVQNASKSKIVAKLTVDVEGKIWPTTKNHQGGKNAGMICIT